MRYFSITLTKECGPYVNILADSYEFNYWFPDKKPSSITFYKDKDMVCMIDYHNIYELAEIKNEEYIKLDLPK